MRSNYFGLLFGLDYLSAGSWKNAGNAPSSSSGGSRDSRIDNMFVFDRSAQRKRDWREIEKICPEKISTEGMQSCNSWFLLKRSENIIQHPFEPQGCDRT